MFKALSTDVDRVTRPNRRRCTVQKMAVPKKLQKNHWSGVEIASSRPGSVWTQLPSGRTSSAISAMAMANPPSDSMISRSSA